MAKPKDLTFYQVWQTLSEKARKAVDRELDMRAKERATGKVVELGAPPVEVPPLEVDDARPFFGAQTPDGKIAKFATRDEAVASCKAAGQWDEANDCRK